MKIGFALAALGCAAFAFCRYALIMTFAAGFASGPDESLFANQALWSLAAAAVAAILAGTFGWSQMRHLIPGIARWARRQRGFVIPTAIPAFGFRKFRY